MPLQRKRSWMNWDGCEPIAAWQPLYAPSYRDSLWNWRDNFIAAGIAPSFALTTGWTFDGSTQYLDTGITGLPISATWLVMCTDGPVDGVTAASPFGVYSLNPDVRRTAILLNFFGSQLIGNASSAWTQAGSGRTAGVFSCADRTYYEDGSFVATLSAAGAAITDKPIYIGAAAHPTSGLSYPFPGKVQALAIWEQTLTAAQVWQRSQMMAHLEVSDWNAWAPARRYYFAPSATVFSPAWARGTNRLIGGS